MNIYVCIKQVPDTETKIKLKPDFTWIDTSGIKWVMSPFDEYAVEEALRVKEKNAGSTVIVVSAGPTRVIECIRTALAMGADSGIHIEIPETADNNMTAKALANAMAKKETASVDLVFTGKEAIDDGSAQVSQLLAGFLGLPYVSVVLNVEYGAQSVKCKREIEGGAYEIVETALPAIIATQKGINEPRYATLPNIMKAKKKEIKTYKTSDLGISEGDQKIKFKNFELPPPKQAGKKVSGDPAAQAKELARLLHEEAKVI